MTKTIGRGGCSCVYRPQTKDTQKKIVIKRPLPRIAEEDTENIVSTYKNQKRVLDQLHKKNPTKSKLFNEIYQLDQQKKQLKMKDLGEYDLYHAIVDTNMSGHLNTKFEDMYQQLTDAVITMIQSDVFHRDIKPENIMVAYDASNDEVSLTFIDFADSITTTDIGNQQLA